MIDHRYDVVQPDPYITPVIPDSNFSLVLRSEANQSIGVSSKLTYDTAARTLGWMAAWQLGAKRNGSSVTSLFKRHTGKVGELVIGSRIE